MAAPRLPLSTYRLQFNRAFRFAEARALAPYLDQLGISDLYASPLVQARRGSPHGYDVTDPSRLNPELDNEKDFDALSGELRRRRMGLLLDIVPNHMAASSENPWWFDVLENGPASLYADYFDIDWRPDPAFSTLEGKILLPLLGAPYAEVLQKGELTLTLGQRGLAVRYYEAWFPLNPKTYRRLLAHGLEHVEKRLGRKHVAVRELRGLLDALDNLPEGPGAKELKQRHAAKEALKARLWRLYQEQPEIRKFVDENLRRLNGRKGDAGSYSRLSRLLDAQSYRLAFWRTGAERLNYRRFFDISELVSLRIEQPAVFAARHALLFRLVGEGKVTGVRVDHVDGLYDPADYLNRLQETLRPVAPGSGRGKNFYVVVEKILSGAESLPDDWPVAGTTGYDFLNTLNRVFVDARGARTLTALYRRFTGAAGNFEDVIYASKKLVMATLFPGEMRTLAGQLSRLVEADRQGRDLPRRELEAALVEVTARFPVYRTYTRDVGVSPHDRRVILAALEEARRRNPGIGAASFDFLQRLLLLEGWNQLSGAEKEARLGFVRRWQQFTGPLMAKGFEDTALYVYSRLTSLNEVGGEPESGEPASEGVSLDVFHRRLQQRHQRWPATLNATASHDTKRGEDVRARLNVLSELPAEWQDCVGRWSRWNRKQKGQVNGGAVPDANEEYLLYQTLLGAWPLEAKEIAGLRERLQHYMVKAAREAKVHTRWRQVNTAHEAALRAFVAAILRKSGRNQFLRDFRRFQKKIAFYGALNGLAQVLVKIAAPGVPDFYQGTELWDLCLVDPDNRRPVDFKRRARLLEELRKKEAAAEGLAGLLRELLNHWEDGRVKLYLTWKALNFRRAHPALFLQGDYVPLFGRGGKRESVCAFARRRGEEWALMAVPRLATRLVGTGQFPLGRKVWGASALSLPAGAPTRWRNVLTGETLAATSRQRKKSLPLAQVFERFPVALLLGL